MYTGVKPLQHIPQIHTHTVVIIFPKASLSHTVSQEVLSPKTYTPTNYQPVHVKNVLIQIPGHYVVMFERHTSHPAIHTKLLREGMWSLLKHAFMCVPVFLNMFVNMATWNKLAHAHALCFFFFFSSTAECEVSS